MSCDQDCEHSAIPPRLHARGRLVVGLISAGGRLFLFHDHVPSAQRIGSWFKYRGNNQSVISDELNKDGDCRDVLWDTRTGELHSSKMIVCLPVDEVRRVEFPDNNVARRDPRNGNKLPFLPEDYFTFDVIHQPEPCMYPHCEIRAMKMNELQSKMTKGMQNIARESFREIAERYSSEWIEPEEPSNGAVVPSSPPPFAGESTP